MKKYLGIIQIAIIVFLSVTTALAEDISVYDASSGRVYVHIAIANGQVSGDATAFYNGAGTIKLVVTIQKKSGTTWVPVATGNGTSFAHIATTAIKGVTYRACGKYYVYDESNRLIMSGSGYSSENTY